MNSYNLKALEADIFDFKKKVAPFYGLLYGWPGSGKTVMAMQIAQALTPIEKSIILIDASTGWVTLYNHPELQDRANGVTFKNFEQIRQYAAALGAGAGTFRNVGTVVFDELSVITASILNSVAETREASATNRLEPGALDQRDYGITQNMLRRLLFDFTKVPGLHIIATAHERRDKLNKEAVKFSPAFPPGAWGLDIARLFHIVGRTTAEIYIQPGKPDSYIRQVQVHGTNTVEAKSRVGGLKPRVSPPELIKRIKEWSNLNESPVEPQAVIIEPELAFNPEELNGIEVD